MTTSWAAARSLGAPFPTFNSSFSTHLFSSSCRQSWRKRNAELCRLSSTLSARILFRVEADGQVPPMDSTHLLRSMSVGDCRTCVVTAFCKMAAAAVKLHSLRRTAAKIVNGMCAISRTNASKPGRRRREKKKTAIEIDLDLR